MKKMTKMAAILMSAVLAGSSMMAMTATAYPSMLTANAAQKTNNSNLNLSCFTRGVYQVKIDGSDQTSYFIFNDKSSGRTDNSYGIGVDFTCVQSAQSVDFYFGDMRTATPMQIDSVDNGTINGSIYGHTYTCKLMKEQNPDTFDAATYEQNNKKTAKQNTSSKKNAQNPIQNYTGTYGCYRATMKVSALGKDQATVSVYWSSSAFEHSEWTMSGKVAVKNGSVVFMYSDCIKETIVYDMDGSLKSDTIDYAFGSGTITFTGNQADWFDMQENIADGSLFVYAN